MAISALQNWARRKSCSPTASSTQEALLERTPSIIDLEIERGTLSRSRSGSREFLAKAAAPDEEAMSSGTALQFVFLGFVSLSLLVALRLLRREPAAEAASLALRQTLATTNATITTNTLATISDLVLAGV